MRVSIRSLGLLTFLAGALLSGQTISIPVWLWAIVVFFAIALSLVSLELDNSGGRSIYWFGWAVASITLGAAAWIAILT